MRLSTDELQNLLPRIRRGTRFHCVETDQSVGGSFSIRFRDDAGVECSDGIDVWWDSWDELVDRLTDCCESVTGLAAETQRTQR